MSKVNSSCRTVALWCYILVSDHNATDPVMQKVANYCADFFAHFNYLFLHFQVYSSILVCSENCKVLGVSLTMRIGINICLD